MRQAKIEPNTVIGLVEELHICHLGIDSGIDVRVPGAVHPAQKVWVNACANEAQNCRVAVKDAEGAMSEDETTSSVKLEDTNVA